MSIILLVGHNFSMSKGPCQPNIQVYIFNMHAILLLSIPANECTNVEIPYATLSYETSKTLDSFSFSCNDGFTTSETTSGTFTCDITGDWITTKPDNPCLGKGTSHFYWERAERGGLPVTTWLTESSAYQP